MKTETIYEILEREHKTVQGILDKIDETTAPAARAHLLQRLEAELLPHMHAEEHVFYGPLRAQEESHETALDAKEEHRAATHVLKELARLSPENELWAARFHVLKENIEHHVEEEEGKVFKKARQVFDTDEAVAMGQQFQTEKKEYIAGQASVKRAS